MVVVPGHAQGGNRPESRDFETSLMIRGCFFCPLGKKPGKYVEGVVLSDKIETLFRNVPPASVFGASDEREARKSSTPKDHG